MFVITITSIPSRVCVTSEIIRGETDGSGVSVTGGILGQDPSVLTGTRGERGESVDCTLLVQLISNAIVVSTTHHERVLFMMIFMTILLIGFDNRGMFAETFNYNRYQETETCPNKFKHHNRYAEKQSKGNSPGHRKAKA